MRRILPALSAAALLGVVLAGCSAPAPSDDEDSSEDAAAVNCPAAPSGSVSEGVEVGAEADAEPTVAIDAPLAVDETERTVVTEGDGEEVDEGAAVKIAYAVYNGTSGDKIETVGWGGQPAQPFTADAASTLPGLYKLIVCSTVGSRVVAVIPPADAFGEAGQSEIGVAPEDDLVIVADIVELVVLPTPAEWTDAVPEVDVDADPPVVTLPSPEPSADYQLAVLEDGDGATVKDGDSVTVDYQGTNWNTGQIFDQSYGKEPATFPTGGVVPGFGGALVGQKVGSTVIVTIPPELGYGTDPSGGELAGQTLVFLIQIRDTAAAG